MARMCNINRAVGCEMNCLPHCVMHVDVSIRLTFSLHEMYKYHRLLMIESNNPDLRLPNAR